MGNIAFDPAAVDVIGSDRHIMILELGPVEGNGMINHIIVVIVLRNKELQAEETSVFVIPVISKGISHGRRLHH